MLVVFPNSLQYDTNHVPTYYEDHLLERVSTLEMQLGQTVEKLELAYDFINRCLELFEKDHHILQAFLETVKELNPELSATLNRRSKEISRNLSDSQANETKKNRILESIQQQHDKPNAELFTKIVNQGIDLLERKEEKEAFQMLERAALLSPKNSALLIFIAENYFFSDQFSKSKSYLEKAFEISPTNPKVLLLLGAILADEGEITAARRWLSVIIHHEKKSIAANYIWGMTAIFESNFEEAAAAFKLISATDETAEIEYLLGCVYFELKTEKNAFRHFQKAIELDSNYSDAFFMQSLVYKSENKPEDAETARKNASEKKENGAQCSEFLKKSDGNGLESALPFIHFQRKNVKLLTGGALRLTKFFKKQILKAIE